MNVLITGINGFIGRNLHECFSSAESEEYNLFGLGRNKLPEKNNKKYLKKYICCDLGITENTLDTCFGIDCVIHLAGISDSDAKVNDYILNTDKATENLMESAVRHKIKKIIYLSSYKLNNTNSAYSQSKKNAESVIKDYCIQHGITYTIIRSSLVYGKGMKNNLASWINKIRAGQILRIPESNSTIPMIGLIDLVSLLKCCVSNVATNNKIYSVTDCVDYKVNEIEEQVRIQLGYKDNGRTYPRFALYIISQVGDFCKWIGIPFVFDSRAYNIFFNSTVLHDRTLFNDCDMDITQNFWKYLKSEQGIN